jgi:gliding motility-associated-like protein
MKKNYCLLLFSLLIFSSAVFGQINVTVNPIGASLAQIITGNGVTISNVNLNCPDGAAGSFTCTSCSLNMDSGIVLTNGLAQSIEGPNDATIASYGWGTPGDDSLAAYINQPDNELFDACALTFDIVAPSDSIQFKYIFGSEEYPEFVCSTYNDAFAFFISGPGITGEQNMALIPGTNIPVRINSVNSGTVGNFGGTCTGAGQSRAYSQYYVNNGDGTQAPYDASTYYIRYNGFTTTLTASMGGLTPCSTYHLKLVIADVGNDGYDSGVFIEANSLSSNQITFDTSHASLTPDSAIRGCADGIINLNFSKPVSQATTVNYTIGGTAVNGADYTFLPGSAQVLAGDSSTQITIHPIGTSTQIQTVILYLTNLCSTTPYDSITLYIVAAQQITTNNDTSICPGDTVQLIANGAPGTTYSWSPATNISATNISNPLVFPPATTTYICSATLNGCTSVDSVVVTIYTTPPFSVSAGPDITSCGGAVQLNATVTGNPISGTSFIYNWVPGSGLTSSTIPNPLDTSSVSNTYIIFVTSGHCSTTDTINVTIDSVQASLSSTAASCSYSATGTATANVTTGTAPYGYQWSSGALAATANNLSAGLYNVTITDNLGCTAMDTITVYAPQVITFGVPVITDVSCPGGDNGSATITAAGGTGVISYAWSSGSTTGTASNLAAANYTVTATDASGCTATTTVTIGTLPPVAIVISTTGVPCFGGLDGTVTATVSGGTSPYGYLWSNTATTSTITGLTMGSYQVTVTDNAGCTASANSNVTQAPLLTSSEDTTDVSCYGASNGGIIISPSGGTTPYSYLWSDGSTLQNRINIPPNTYLLTITDALGCTTYDTAVITQPAALMLSDSVVNATCYGMPDGAIYLTVTGGTLPYLYSWGNGINSQNATHITAGNYYPTITDNLGCFVTNEIIVSSPGQIVFDSALVINPTCYGKSNGIVQVYAYNGVPGYTYAWNGNVAQNPDSNLAAGLYAVIVTDANNCTAVDSVLVSQPTELTLTVTGQNSLCYAGGDGNAVDIVAGGTPPYHYAWSNGQSTQTATLLTAGLYESTVTDEMGCAISGNVVIGEPAQILYSIDSTPVKCIGSKDGTITVDVTSGGVPPYNYAATTDLSDYAYTTDSVILGLDTGYYTVLISDANGCTLLDTTYVPNAVPDSFSITTDSTSCFGPQYADGAIYVNGLVGQNSPFEYGVDGSPLQIGGDFYSLAAGTHSIQITNYNGCVTDTSAFIGMPLAGVAEVLPHDTTMQVGEIIQLFSSFANYPATAIVSYNWTPSMGLSCVDCPNPVVNSYNHINNYTLTITYNKGCTASDSATVIVTGNPQVFIPNSFTPNGDGNNDVFLIYGENIKTVNLKIFNRWGELVFNSESQYLGWDGNYKGHAQLPGVYVYEAEITFLDNTQTLRTGSITLIR